MNADGRVLLLAETEPSGIAEESMRALAFAGRLADSAYAAVDVVLFEDREEAADAVRQLSSYGISGTISVGSNAIPGYAPAAWAKTLSQLADSADAIAIVAAATDRGSEVLAHLGAMTGLPVAANCMAARLDSPRQWRLIRQRWAGSLLEEAALEAHCALLTVAADAPASDVQPEVAADGGAGAGGAEAGGAGAPPSVRVYEPDLSEADLRVCAAESAAASGGVSLATARVVVGGGRGVGGPDGFAPLEELAELLGGVLGVSRVVTSQGWRPHRQQVGQTGTKISPELYLACGISGAIQHMAGCLSSKHIVVINTDEDAPIILHADYAVIGDLTEVVPALVSALKTSMSRL
ncbi:MAG TPA: electron transfer flavoprotein subunit alpha/FixB family protein [Streptosporangiaceae bacterium]|nr:electron transfer flavoprotein subunit alpha/FixB family protein [Streptosporangiaceae bacterium]